VNFCEDREACTLYRGLPGIERKKIKVNLDRDICTNSATRKRENDQGIECTFASFNRSFRIPATVTIPKRLKQHGKWTFGDQIAEAGSVNAQSDRHKE
jgi:HSP20 family molecular chaperone IbpA